MPTYEYRCDKCGEHHEVVQSFRDDPLTECPACGGRLKKVFGSIGVVFKGSGFYKTDSRSASKSAAKDGDRSATKEKETAKSSSESSSSTATSSDSSGSSTSTDKSTSKSNKESGGSNKTPSKAAAAS